MDYHPFQLQENPHDVIIQSYKSSQEYGIALIARWWFNHFLWLVHKQLSLVFLPMWSQGGKLLWIITSLLQKRLWLSESHDLLWHTATLAFMPVKVTTSHSHKWEHALSSDIVKVIICLCFNWQGTKALHYIYSYGLWCFLLRKEHNHLLAALWYLVHRHVSGINLLSWLLNTAVDFVFCSTNDF